MSISWGGFSASGTTRMYSPAETGESTSVVRDTGLNVISLPLHSRWEAACQISIRRATSGSPQSADRRKSIPRDRAALCSSSGRSSCPWLMRRRCRCPHGPAGEMKSREASTLVTPAGTSTWNVHPSARSRRHFRVWPLAVNFSPARSCIGPVGPCSPGIHFG